MVVVGRSGGLLVGDGVVHPVFEGYEAWLLDMVADFGDGDIEGYATYPGVGVAVASEAWPGLPEVTGNFLVEVADCIGGAVGVVEADMEDGALAAVEHIKELSVVVVAERIRPQQGKQGMPCFGSVMLSGAVLHMFVCRLFPGTCCVRLGCGQFYPLSIILVAKIRKSNKLDENFFLRFFDGIGFQCDGDVFLWAEALGEEQRIRADASVLARDKAVGTAGMECPNKGRKGGGGWV